VRHPPIEEAQQDFSLLMNMLLNLWRGIQRLGFELAFKPGIPPSSTKGVEGFSDYPKTPQALLTMSSAHLLRLKTSTCIMTWT
jgi:hypothetical protein